MKKLTQQQKEEIIKKIQQDKPLSDEYRFLIPFETEREYELVYAGKERKEDILADTLSVPFQPIKKFGEVKEGEWHNMLIFGDNLQALKHLLKLKEQGKLRNPDGRNGVKLIYIDPPFATEQEFRGSKGEKAYQDKIAGAEFLEFLRKRLIFLKELLTDDGCIYVHLDWKKVHYIKVLLDEIFDENNFVREIIWRMGWVSGFKSVANNWIRNHETILFYAKDANNFIFNKMYLPYPKGYERWGGRPKGQGLPIEDMWGVFEKEGLTSLAVVSFAQQDTSYPTQKPEGLLARIIKASSNPGDIVLDAFAGSGTTGAVAEKLGRKWIMIDSSKLAIYTIQKRMLNLKAEIGNKGKPLKPRPFVLYNAGLYLDSGFIEKMDEEDYRKFVLELFNSEPSGHKIKGVDFHGILNNRPVMVFSQKDYLTHEFIEDLHKTVGNGLKDEMYIIAPQSAVRFNEDYVEKGKIRYHILKVPYSIIQKILEKGFVRGLQPLSKANINQTIESVGFDFIYPPKVECEYYKGRENTLFNNLVIKIKKFEPVQISKKPVEFEDPKKEALSMVMIDKDYDAKVFDMDYYFFNDEIVKNDFKVIFPDEKAGPKIMIIYLDVLGNEKVEVKDIKDFKKK
jgi:site-specific DNA-methyltransferase (adenine-specific)/adenine-specific DNA-methyltransferase